MPVPLTYPGVYIEEIPSGIHTITGVATSITAFVGRALRGPVGKPITINSFKDYERTFGGLWTESAMSFAVQDFYLNGGRQAIIVRLYRQSSSPPPLPPAPRHARIHVTGGGGAAPVLELEAIFPGSWGNNLRARIDYDTLEEPPPTDRENPVSFNLTVRDGGTDQIETFRKVSVRSGSPRSVVKVLAAESRLVRVVVVGEPSTRTPSAHANPGPGANIWADDGNFSDGVSTLEADRGSDGVRLEAWDFVPSDGGSTTKGLYALDESDLFNLLCIPPYKGTAPDWDVDDSVIEKAASYCEVRRAMLLLDPPGSWVDKEAAKEAMRVARAGTRSKNAAIFFPRILRPNPLLNDLPENFAPCGAVAGVFARTDAERGVWKAPAGLAATLVGAPGLSVPLTDAENGELNPLGINCLRAMLGAGCVVWGARTLQGDDRLTSEWKYIPVRRLALFIEESLYRGTQWMVFEPNDEPLWSQIRLNVGAFMQNLFRQGAFQGKTPREAYLVKCDRETTTQNDINLGIVNIVVGFAPLKPAEFVVIRIQQLAGQVEA